MLPLLTAPLLSLLTSWPPLPAKPDPTVKTDFRQMVAAEVAFAAYGSQHSVQDAFSRYLSTAWMFSGGAFQTGAVLYGNQPEKPGRILWRPTYADIAASGDLGFTTGPWELRPGGAHEKPVAFGDFVTLWQKGRDGSWQAIYDGGISHPAYATAPKAIWPATYPLKRPAAADTAQARLSLIAAEEALVQRARLSLRQAYKPVLGPPQELRLLREGQLPYVGNGARALVETSPKAVQLTPLRTGVSAAGDFGYTLGYHESKPERGFFLHVWRRSTDRWLLVLEVLSPDAV